MIQLIRGEGPPRPDKAKALGFATNDAPLFQIFRAFRRTSPHSKTAGAYARIMIVKDNDRAVEMAAYFNDGHPEYQDDSKWWELVEEADRELLYGTGTKPKGGEDVGKPGVDLPGGLVDGGEPAGGPQSPPVTPANPVPVAPVEATPRQEIPSLSRKYVYQKSNASWNVTAFEVQSSDSELPAGAPWSMPLADVATRNYHYLYNPNHPVFRSITMTPRDGLLIQLAWMTAELLRTSKNIPDLGDILADLRNDYGDDTLLDSQTMATEAATILIDIAKALVGCCADEDRAALFNELAVTEQQSVMRALAAKKIKPTSVTADGSFLQYAPYEILRAMIERHPEYCFDGRIWDEAFEALDYGANTDVIRPGIPI